jgi:hypothetical protein
MQLEMHLRRAILMISTGLVWASCTFPSVDYESACAAPPSCENDANSCTKKAEADQNACSMKCSMSCLECDTDFDRALGMCVAQCESCSASAGCTNASASCKALLGVP